MIPDVEDWKDDCLLKWSGIAQVVSFTCIVPEH